MRTSSALTTCVKSVCFLGTDEREQRVDVVLDEIVILPNHFQPFKMPFKIQGIDLFDRGNIRGAKPVWKGTCTPLVGDLA